MMMNQGDINSSNTSAEAVYQHSEKESPPFAIDDHFFYTKEHRNIFHEIPSEETYTSKQHHYPQSILARSSNTNNDADKKRMKLATHSNQHCSIMTSYSLNSLTSMPPGLIESDVTSCCSALSEANSDVTKSINYQMKKPPPLSTGIAMSSKFSTSSLKSSQSELRESDQLSNIYFYHGISTPNMDITSPSFAEPRTIIRQSESSGSIGFSELMRAADDTIHVSGHRSNTRMPPLLESQEVESGALISAAPEYICISDTPVIATTKKIQKWWHIIPLLGSRSHIANRELGASLLNSTASRQSQSLPSAHPHPRPLLQITRLLSNDSFQKQYANLALERARATVHTKIESDDSFEASFFLGENSPCSVDDVMEVISNADLLSIWCDPIEKLIVISNSSDSSSLPNSLDETRRSTENSGFDGTGRFCDDNERIREYEGEWIEATTSVLESPSSNNVGFIFSAGQRFLQSLGFASYGRITMFIERRRGRIGLTVGPFHCGIHASHTITVSEDASSGRIRIVDRIRLTYDEEVSLARIFGCTMGSCLNHCFLPSVVGYLDQVTTSMARLRILLENKNPCS